MLHLLSQLTPKAVLKGQQILGKCQVMKTKSAKPRGKKFTQRQQRKMSNDFLCWHHLAVFPKKKKKQTNKKPKKKKHVIHRPPGRSCRLLREFHSNRIFCAKLSEYNKGHKILYRSTCISLPTSNRLSVIICSTRASERICVQFTTKFGYNISLQSIEKICCRRGWLMYLSLVIPDGASSQFLKPGIRTTLASAGTRVVPHLECM